MDVKDEDEDESKNGIQTVKPEKRVVPSKLKNTISKSKNTISKSVRKSTSQE